MEKILLKDILKFDDLKKKYPKKRIKLRFNTSWLDINSAGEKLYRDYSKMYITENEEEKVFFHDSIMSSKSNKKARISDNDIIFQFIEIKYHVWLLVDAVVIINKVGTKKGYNNFTEREFDVAEGESIDIYKPFFGRLTVDWVNKPQQFFYVNDEIINNIVVREVSSKCYLYRDEEFCGYEKLSLSYSDLKNVIDKQMWKDALRNVYGVYLLTDANTGKLYVGSATGENGIYGRWHTYLDKGYDEEECNKEYPNKRLKELVKSETIDYIKRNFYYTVLEIFSKNEFGKDKALERESYWKMVLKTREKGYNDN